mmetsp:Transcript_5153/g.12127  ORF Transcript_5153/g.12127 Transcript_5153/m.12127 type:complete len:221 (+) Transcript_5153:253-915(+)
MCRELLAPLHPVLHGLRILGADFLGGQRRVRGQLGNHVCDQRAVQPIVAGSVVVGWEVVVVLHGQHSSLVSVEGHPRINRFSVSYQDVTTGLGRWRIRLSERRLALRLHLGEPPLLLRTGWCLSTSLRVLPSSRRRGRRLQQPKHSGLCCAVRIPLVSSLPCLGPHIRRGGLAGPRDVGVHEGGVRWVGGLVATEHRIQALIPCGGLRRIQFLENRRPVM